MNTKTALLALGTVTASLLLAFTAVLSAAYYANYHGDGTPTPTTLTRTATQPPTGPAYRDGNFQFTINTTPPTCGIPQIGNDAIIRTAHGQYCTVDVTIRNLGPHPALLILAAQRLHTTDGICAPDDVTTLYASTGDHGLSRWPYPINPGQTATGLIVFDISTGATPTAVELHESYLSIGVTIPFEPGQSPSEKQ